MLATQSHSVHSARIASGSLWRSEYTNVHYLNIWYYFSSGALRALEWGHYLGALPLLANWLTGLWVLATGRANLSITDRLLWAYF